MNKDKAYWSAIIRTLVAKEMRVEPETIDPEQKFTSYGLDSIVALSVSGDLEDLTKLELEPTLLRKMLLMLVFLFMLKLSLLIGHRRDLNRP